MIKYSQKKISWDLKKAYLREDIVIMIGLFPTVLLGIKNTEEENIRK